MGTADLLAAFNAVAEPAYSAQKAFLRYGRNDDGQFQVISFRGTAQNGTAFDIESDPLPAEADVNLAAAALAQKLIQPKETPQ